jgi:hypothetical protein
VASKRGAEKQQIMKPAGTHHVGSCLAVVAASLLVVAIAKVGPKARRQSALDSLCHCDGCVMDWRGLSERELQLVVIAIELEYEANKLGSIRGKRVNGCKFVDQEKMAG